MSTREKTTDQPQEPAGGELSASAGSAWGDAECDDEKHIAIALYLIQKAIALRETEGNGWPTIHACLRDAAAHCEAARLHWTEEAMLRRKEILRKVFGGDPQNKG